MVEDFQYKNYHIPVHFVLCIRTFKIHQENVLLLSYLALCTDKGFHYCFRLKLKVHITMQIKARFVVL